jgi:hypothetical protein
MKKIKVVFTKKEIENLHINIREYIDYAKILKGLSILR